MRAAQASLAALEEAVARSEASADASGAAESEAQRVVREALEARCEQLVREVASLERELATWTRVKAACGGDVVRLRSELDEELAWFATQALERERLEQVCSRLVSHARDLQTQLRASRRRAEASARSAGEFHFFRVPSARFLDLLAFLSVRGPPPSASRPSRSRTSVEERMREEE